MKTLSLLIATVTSLLLPVASFRVARLEDGDVFDNIEGSEMSCTASGATCSEGYNITSVPLYYEDCDEYNLFNGSCSACKCTNGGRLNLLTFQCEPRTDFIDSSASGLEECPSTVGFYPFESLEPFPGSPQLIPRQFLLLNKTFSCFGKITKWKIRQFNARLFSCLFAIQVWRQVGEWFFLVNSTFFDVPESQGVGYTDVEYELDGNEIYFQPGDFLGAFTFKGLYGFPFAARPVIPLPPHSSVAYVFNTLSTPPERLHVTDVRRIFYGVVAHLTAIVDPSVEEETFECFDIEPPSPTDPQPQTSPTTVESQGPTEKTASEPLIPVLGVAAGGAMLLIIIALGCVVVIGLVVYCNIRRRRKGGMHHAPQEVNDTYTSPYTYITTSVPPTPTTPYTDSRAASFDHIYETLPELPSEHHVYAVLECPIPNTPECPSLHPRAALESPTPGTVALCSNSEGVSSRPASTADATQRNDHKAFEEELCRSANTEDKEGVIAKEPPKIPTSLKEGKLHDNYSSTKENKR